MLPSNLETQEDTHTERGTVGTRMRSTMGSFKINRVLTVHVVKCVLYCTVRWIVLCIFV